MTRSFKVKTLYGTVGLNQGRFHVYDKDGYELQIPDTVQLKLEIADVSDQLDELEWLLDQLNRGLDLTVGIYANLKAVLEEVLEEP